MIDGFGFDDADLAANRAGRLTERQVQRVRFEMERRVKILAGWLLAGPAAVASLLVIGSALFTDSSLSLPSTLVIAYLVTAALVAPLTVLAMYANYVRPIRKRTPSSATGRIKLIERGDDVHLKVGSTLHGARFALDQEQAEALVDGNRYTIYFTPGGRRAVFHSIEPEPEPEPEPEED